MAETTFHTASHIVKPLGLWSGPSLQDQLLALVKGKMWSDQLFMATDGLFNGKPIVLSTGRLIAPVEREARIDGGDQAGSLSSRIASRTGSISSPRMDDVFSQIAEC